MERERERERERETDQTQKREVPTELRFLPRSLPGGACQDLNFL